MLVLSRKVGERILLGEDIVISVVRIGPNTVKIGIDAPKDMNIVREELCLNLTQANLAEASDRASSPIRKPGNLLASLPCNLTGSTTPREWPSLWPVCGLGRFVLSVARELDCGGAGGSFGLVSASKRERDRRLLDDRGCSGRRCRCRRTD